MKNEEKFRITGHLSFKDRGIPELDLGPPVRFHLDEYLEDPARRIAEGWGGLLVTYEDVIGAMFRDEPIRKSWEFVLFNVFLVGRSPLALRLEFNDNRKDYMFGHDFMARMMSLKWQERRRFVHRFRQAARKAISSPASVARFLPVLHQAAQLEHESLLRMGHLAHLPSLHFLEWLAPAIQDLPEDTLAPIIQLGP